MTICRGARALLLAGFVAGLIACDGPPDAGGGDRGAETLGQAQAALVCRAGTLHATKANSPLQPPTYSNAGVAFSPQLKFFLPTQIPVTHGNSGHGREVLTLATPAGADIW